ncbi:septum site-determining protein MinD [Anaerovorax odorimutans]|uniref:Septum site-determining protein MinD n=1 Tax=Anaerovorax odorimutans TaxID=109327 RepID=A0ABT1RSA9_9FIRM|nr:septum site-determining protein MinD [Anaerovorax odorimutans]MCQ4638088.1 septum site-determining protein MinD [Anaerovorax odorimutans]
MGEVILVASGKGGTGKTAVTANMGALLARQGYKVALLDMDMGMRNLDLYLGLENRVVYNIMDVLSGICKIKRALIKDRRFENLYLMSACPRKDNRDITPLHMEILCRKLKKNFDYVFIDCPAGIGSGLDISLAGADRALLVTEADIAALRDADVLNRYLIKAGIKDTCYIVNKVRVDLMAEHLVPDLKEISEILNSRLIGLIQFDDNIYISTNRGIPIVYKEGTYIEENFRNILRRLMETGTV